MIVIVTVHLGQCTPDYEDVLNVTHMLQEKTDMGVREFLAKQKQQSKMADKWVVVIIIVAYCTHTHTRTHMPAHTHTLTHTLAHSQTHTHTHKHNHTYTHTYAHTHTLSHTHISTLTQTHTLLNKLTHTHTRTPTPPQIHTHARLHLHKYTHTYHGRIKSKGRVLAMERLRLEEAKKELLVAVELVQRPWCQGVGVKSGSRCIDRLDMGTSKRRVTVY